MSDEIVIAGWGAVSPAGWNAGALADMVIEKKSLPFAAAFPMRRCSMWPEPPPRLAWTGGRTSGWHISPKRL